VIREQAGHGPSHVADSEPGQKPEQGRVLAYLDPVEQVLRRLLGKALERQQLLLGEVIQVGGILDEISFDQLLEGGVSEPLDVERSDEVAQMLEHLGGAKRIDAAGDGRARLADEGRGRTPGIDSACARAGSIWTASPAAPGPPPGSRRRPVG